MLGAMLSMMRSPMWRSRDSRMISARESSVRLSSEKLSALHRRDQLREYSWQTHAIQGAEGVGVERGCRLQ